MKYLKLAIILCFHMFFHFRCQTELCSFFQFIFRRFNSPAFLSPGLLRTLTKDGGGLTFSRYFLYYTQRKKSFPPLSQLTSFLSDAFLWETKGLFAVIRRLRYFNLPKELFKSTLAIMQIIM